MVAKLDYPFEAGIVRLVHPSILLERGAEFAGVDDIHRVRGVHLFVIACTINQEAVLAVIYSRSGVSRVMIPDNVRSGHPRWLRSTAHVALHQLWFASLESIDEASRAAR